MRCVKVRVTGYKRLANASCNVDARLIAFVGRNEAGKTSLLRALEWFTDDDAEALADPTITHGLTVADDEPVVDVTYYLDEADRATIRDLDLAEAPEFFEIERRRDTSYASALRPPGRRNPAPFLKASQMLEKSMRVRPRQYEQPVEVEYDDEVAQELPSEWATAVIQTLSNPDQTWTATVRGTADRLHHWLCAETPAGKTRDQESADALDRVRKIAIAQHPDALARQRLQERLPQFLQFSGRDRQLPTTSEIGQAEQRARIGGGVRNLLAMAGLDIEAFAESVQGVHERASETALKRANEQLRNVFRQAWNQYGITVMLKNQGTELRVLIDPDDEYSDVTPIHERSDGLKVFVALIALVTRRHEAIAPILLIDEAETHLHYDAQADLLEVLSTYPSVQQVFYTTHSPGCLPMDLGRGIRVVKPDPDDDSRSVLDSVFWNDRTPGFDPLLMEMGAAAAAFSACRQAVVAEGAADMVLLPSLLRLATGVRNLGYQVAPGLAAADVLTADFDAVANKVVFVSDGDKSGLEYARQLCEEVGVPAERVLTHADGRAVEDYLDADCYLEVVNLFIKSDQTIKVTDLSRAKTYAKCVDDWCKRRGLKSPGKRAVASHLVENIEEASLAPGAEAELGALHTKILAAFAPEHV